MKTYTCKIDSRNWMRSTEQAHLTITSPKGGKVSLYKGAFGNKEHIKQLMYGNFNLHQRILGGMTGIAPNEIELTKAEMNELLEISKK